MLRFQGKEKTLKKLKKMNEIEQKGSGIFLNLEERKEIERLLNLRFSRNKIAILLRRSKKTIQVEVNRNEKPYCAHKAQMQADEAKKNRMHNLKNRNSQRGYHISTRLENLEMQMEILTDSIKELMKNDRKNKKL
jgi:IS30 family transposase